MYWFYILALIPLGVGLFLYLKSDKIVWWEWLIGSAASFMVAGIMHFSAIKGMTDDTETWSGKVTYVCHVPRWKEYYEEAIYRTEYYNTTESYSDSKGRTQTRTVRQSRQVFDHWESCRRWHEEYYYVKTSLEQKFNVSPDKYHYLIVKFGQKQSVAGDRRTGEHASRMIDGDPNDYIGINIKSWVEPVTDNRTFENRIKSAPSVFSFVQPPTNSHVFIYPENSDVFQSDRVLGHAKGKINLLLWDQLNAKLGAVKKVNLIIIGWKNESSQISEFQRSKWIGGKKNDLVLCYGIDDSDSIIWTKVFGWSESEICKRNLETILLDNDINKDILALIETEVVDNYKIKDWKKFDYISIEPQTRHFVWFFVIMIITQSCLYAYFSMNDFEKRNT